MILRILDILFKLLAINVVILKFIIMKKLNQLSRDQMKMVLGGTNSSSSAVLNCGPSYGNQECPTGLCCSKFGFCGTGAQFCANDWIANKCGCSGGPCEGFC
jgi:hypothetical protein